VLRKEERVGDWIVETPLGEGGMGKVYRVHSALSRRVVAALKVMKPTAEPDARARFVREAEALAALRHPAIVRVMGFSEDPERDLLYIVMELAVGETLRARMARGPMTLAETLATFVPLAQGLDHAHSLGIFHRDLKPSNVILSRDGTPLLVDFGIAAALEAESLTTTGQLGTLAYLPPEIFRGARTEPAAIDIYAFGLLIHEALTGERPFAIEPGLTPAAASAAVGVKKLQATAIELPAQAPERLRELVRRATDPNPKARPSMHEMRAGLESLVERRATAASESARLVAAATPAAALDDERTMRVPDPTPPSAGRSRRGSDQTTTGGRGPGRRRLDRLRTPLFVGALVAGAIALALVVMLLTRRIDAERAATTAVPTPSPSPSARTVGAKPVMPSPKPSASPPATTPSTDPLALPSVPVRPTPTPTPVPRPVTPPLEAPKDPELDTEAAEPEPTPTPTPPPSDIGGRWELHHDVESTSHQAFAGMDLGYRLNLVQDGARVHGRGQKISENGVLLLPSQRTPIEVEGRIEGDQLVLHFTEIGSARTSRGTMRWRMGPGSTLRGRFSSDAADSSGSSVARRLP
jgi:eukaryotic-like serine/threonine-protein kinase